jgi:uncharacterized protein YpuA (DUF1002 family)
MSQTTTLILLPQTTWSSQVANGNSYTVTGNSQPAASYVITPRALQTVNINLSDVNGNIIIQATLATSPLETDWFKVYELEANGNANSNASMYTNIEGSYVYMRAKVEDFSQGVVNFVKLSY